MKIDIMKLVQLVGVGMSAVEKIKAAKGKDKEAAVIQTVQESVPMIEGITGVDFVNDPALNELLSDYIAARKALMNGLAHAQQLKAAA